MNLEFRNRKVIKSLTDISFTNWKFNNLGVFFVIAVISFHLNLSLYLNESSNFHFYSSTACSDSLAQLKFLVVAFLRPLKTE